MTFLGLSMEGSRDAASVHITYFAIRAGKETVAGQEILECLLRGFEVSLNNDIDEGGEGATLFRHSESGLEMMIGGHGWRGEWSVVKEEDVLVAVTDVAAFNRGGDWSCQGQLTRQSNCEA